MTRQEIFDIVVTSLRLQGVKSRRESGSCLYRGPNNTKCAAGWLIPDEKYKSEFELCDSIGNIIAKDVSNRESCEISLYDCLVEVAGEENLYFISILQDIHDHVSVHAWESEWEKLAKDYNLSMPGSKNV